MQPHCSTTPRGPEIEVAVNLSAQLGRRNAVPTMAKRRGVDGVPPRLAFGDGG